MAEQISDLELHAQTCKQCADALFDGLGEHPFCSEGKMISDAEREEVELERDRDT